MYCVYWIKRKKHQDIYSEGYVGISKDLNRRLFEHKTSPNKMVSSVVNSDDFKVIVYKENLTIDEAKNVEKQLRPSENIGWNLAMGGNIPPKAKKGQKKNEPYKGYFSEISKKNYKNTGLGKWNGSQRQKDFLKRALKGRNITWGDKLSESKMGTRGLIKDGVKKLAKPNSEKWNRLIEEGFKPLVR